MSCNATGNTLEYHHELIAAQTPPWFHLTSGLILLISGVGSFISNGSVIFVFLIKERTRITRSNMYIAAICCLNLIMTTFGTPMVVMSCFNNVWLFGESGCRYNGFLMSFCSLASMLLLTMISVDRYIYVVQPNLAKYLSTTTSIMSIIVCCLITFGFAISPLLGWNQYTYEGVGTSCAIDLVGDSNNGESFILALFVTYFVMPVLVMIFSYGNVYAKVMKDSKAHLRSSLTKKCFNKAKQCRKKLTMEQDLAVTTTIIIGFFLICYTPFTVLLLWKVLNKDAEIDPLTMAIPSMIAKVAGIFTPFVYLSRNKVFRKHVLNVYPCFKSKNRVHHFNNIEQTRITTVTVKDETTTNAHSSKKSYDEIQTVF
ncbi:rhodopsin-like [Mytilus trossulus]|uniref:rhodopsin-like n=1 Tax=Mytilus trossulus TaxID=6551 RepID=UPI003003D523